MCENAWRLKFNSIIYKPKYRLRSSCNITKLCAIQCVCVFFMNMNMQVLTIEPIPAVHWIPVKMKEGKSSSGSTEDSELHQHMARHDMQHLEMVVMMTLAPVRISYRVADKMETIEMSAPEDMDEKVTAAADARDHFRNAELTTTTEREKQSAHLLTELVTLPAVSDPTHAQGNCCLATRNTPRQEEHCSGRETKGSRHTHQ